MHEDVTRVLLTEDQIRQRIAELAAEVDQAYATSDNLLLVGVLKGSVMCMVDLARALKRTVSMDFMAISSYGLSSQTSGVVRVLKDLEADIGGRDVLIVEDIVDSGLTLAYIRSMLKGRAPASLKVLAFLNKPDRREADVELDFVGFDIPNEFVVGYGLDYAEQYRNLPFVGVLNPDVYTRS